MIDMWSRYVDDFKECGYKVKIVSDEVKSC